ncbi:MAG: hypothetical protein U0797_28465 [Gemmataceae bacterium]
MPRLDYLALLLLPGATVAPDLSRIDRSIGKEPAYRTKAPRYALVVIGPEARDRVWLVKDGDDLHVLADKPVRLSPEKEMATDDERNYLLAELALNGKRHANLRARVTPLRRWMYGDYARRPELVAAIEKDPNAEVLSLGIEAELPHWKPKGRVGVFAGCLDLRGALVLTARPCEAPIIHVGGPLEVSFNISRPTLLRGRPSNLNVVVGTPGLGAGTFAVVGYEDAIPDEVRPRISITFPPAGPGSDPPRHHYELPDRC